MSDSDRSPQRGAALLVAVGASAALAVIVTWVLLRATTEYEAAGYRVELQQARLLVSAVLRQARQAAQAGELPLPAPGAVVLITNGRSGSSGKAIAAAVIPAAPAARAWPGITSAPAQPDGSSPGGVGARLEIRAEGDGPSGQSGACEGCSAPPRFFRLRATVWFRRARATRVATLVLGDAGEVRLSE